MNRGYKISSEKKLTLSGAPRRPKRTRRAQTARRRTCSSRTRSYVFLSPLAVVTNIPHSLLRGWCTNSPLYRLQHKLRRTRLPLLSNFLLTSDVIPPVDSDSRASANPLAGPPKTRPPPLYYLPAKLLPSQEAFLQRRKEDVRSRRSYPGSTEC